jgi:hypothetical protein
MFNYLAIVVANIKIIGRTKDSCIAIKLGVNYYTEFDSAFDVDNITIQNAVIWNCLWVMLLK